MNEPYYADEFVTLYHGDCREITEWLDADVLVTDPPYGIAVKTDWSERRPTAWAKGDRPIAGDEAAFDPEHLLAFRHAVIFGGNHFADRLPASPDWLVWDKRRGGTLTPGWSAPDAELAWSNLGRGCRTFSHLWEGYKRDSEVGQHFHPTQKPVALMQWAIGLAKSEGTVADPYAGSGSTLVAAKRLGRRSIGVELDERYCEVAAKRLAQGVLDFGASQ